MWITGRFIEFEAYNPEFRYDGGTVFTSDVKEAARRKLMRLPEGPVECLVETWREPDGALRHAILDARAVKAVSAGGS